MREYALMSAQPARTRRVRAYTVSVFFLETLRTGTAWEVCDGIPEGARVLSAHDSPRHGAVLMMVEHSSFDEVPEGTEAPIYTVRLLRRDPLPPLPEPSAEPYTGQVAMCRACNLTIVYVGPHWIHTGRAQPRHIATPKEAA